MTIPAAEQEAPAATMQMNTRIDRELKRRGDAALRRAGFTPTEGVRALYELAVRYEQEPDELLAALRPQTDAERDARADERARRVRLIDEGAALCRDFCEHHDIASDSVADVPYDVLRADALLEEHGIAEESDVVELWREGSWA